MPSTFLKVRMPANNRISVSASLKTTEIWQRSVGYDPYAPNEGGGGRRADDYSDERAKGIFALARLTGNTSCHTPGACKTCGQLGHLTYQCRNTMQLTKNLGETQKSDESENEEVDEKKERRLLGLDSDSSDENDDADECRSEEKKQKKKKRKKSAKEISKDVSKKKKKKEKKEKKGKHK